MSPTEEEWKQSLLPLVTVEVGSVELAGLLLDPGPLQGLRPRYSPSPADRRPHLVSLPATPPADSDSDSYGLRCYTRTDTLP